MGKLLTILVLILGMVICTALIYFIIMPIFFSFVWCLCAFITIILLASNEG